MIFTISFLLFTYGFVCCSFSNSFSIKLRLFKIFLAPWGRPVLLWISLLRLILLCPIYLVLLCVHFHLSWLLISIFTSLLTHLLLSAMLYSLCVFVSFSDFFMFFVIDFYFHTIFVRGDSWYNFNPLKYIETFLCPNMWSILENVPCTLEKNVYSAAFDEILKILIKFIWLSVPFKAAVSLLKFCLDDVFIDGNGGWKSLTVTELLSISPITSIKVCFTYLGVPMLNE